MNFKDKKDMELFFQLHPLVMLVLVDMYSYCYDNKMPFTLTDTVSTIEEDRELNRVSSSHRTKRAADIRTNQWNHLELKDFVNYFSNKYKKIAAISGSGKPELIVVHDSGNGMHAHIQIHSRYSL